MKTVRKLLLHEGQNTLNIEKGGKILLVRNQNQKPHVWIEIDENEIVQENIVLHVIGTNTTIYDNWLYVDSYMDEYQLMWHVYQVI